MREREKRQTGTRSSNWNSDKLGPILLTQHPQGPQIDDDVFFYDKGKYTPGLGVQEVKEDIVGAGAATCLLLPHANKVSQHLSISVYKLQQYSVPLHILSEI